MATIQLQAPNPFNFKHPDDWQKWKRRFEQYRHASGLATETEQRQVSTLLYCLGKQAEDVLFSTGISVDDRKKYSDQVSVGMGQCSENLQDVVMKFQDIVIEFQNVVM